MSLEQAIHARWADCEALSTLLPAERVFTGLARGDVTLPYALLAQDGARPKLRTSSGTRVEEVSVRLVVWSASLVEAKQIADAIESCFDDMAFELAEGSVKQSRRAERTERAHDNGRWEIAIAFHVWIEHLREDE